MGVTDDARCPKNPDSADTAVRAATLKVLELPDRLRGSEGLRGICDILAEFLSVSATIVSVAGPTQVEVLAAYGISVAAIPREDSLSSYITSKKRLQAFVVEDVAKDVRIQGFPWVREHGYRFYASAPLLASNGQYLGHLTLLDSKPSKRPAEDYNLLCSFAELAAREMELGFYSRLEGLLPSGVAAMLREPGEVEEPVFLCEVTSRWWTISFVNRSARKLTHLLQLPEPHFWGVFQPVDGAKNLAQKLAYAEIEQGNDFTLQVKLRERSKGEKDFLTIFFRSALGSTLSTAGTTIGIPNEVDTADQLFRKIRHTHYFATVLGPSTGRPEKKLLGSPQTFLSREFRGGGGSASGRMQADTAKGMSNVKLGIVCASSVSACIYRAQWSKQPVCVKVTAKRLEQCVQSKEYGSAMLPKEAALSAELAHPNVVRTYKIVVQPKIADNHALDYRKGDEVVEASIVREWCSAGDLQALTERGLLLGDQGEPDAKLIVSIAGGIAAGLEYLHHHNIIHGALKPTSVLMADDPHPHQRCFIAKVAGLSRAEVSAKPVQAAAVTQDDPFAAPELATKGLMSKASDVFAFGKLVCYMYGNGRLRAATCDARTSRKVGRDACSVPEGLPARLEMLVKGCLAPKPANRPTFAAIREQLISIALDGPETPLAAADVASRADEAVRPALGKPSVGARTSMNQAKAAVGNIARVSSNLGLKLSRRDTERRQKPPPDFSELLGPPAGQSGGAGAATEGGRRKSASALLGKKLRSLISLPKHVGA